MSGEYTQFSASKTIPLTKNISILPSVNLGYNDKFLRDKSGFSHIEGGISLPVKLKSAELVPYVNYSQPLTNGFKKSFHGGIKIKPSFKKRGGK